MGSFVNFGELKYTITLISKNQTPSKLRKNKTKIPLKYLVQTFFYCLCNSRDNIQNIHLLHFYFVLCRNAGNMLRWSPILVAASGFGTMLHYSQLKRT